MSRIAFVVGEEFEDVELTDPFHALRDDHEIDIIGATADDVTGKQGTTARIDHAVADADPSVYDALVIPGGYSPDHLRTDEAVVRFVSHFRDHDKTIAAVCHAPSLLIEADAVQGRTMTSWPSIRTDLRNAGATVVDQEVVVDGNLITSRNPDDLPAFGKAILHALEASS